MPGTIAQDTLTDAPLTLAGRSFRSRLMVGTGKYRSNARDGRGRSRPPARKSSPSRCGGSTWTAPRKRASSTTCDPDQYFLLANTAGCYTADEAIRYARLAREAGFNEFVKLEVIGDRETLLPDTDGLLAAARTLVARRVPGARLHQRRPHHRAPARGRRLRGGHAARLAHRQRARPAQSVQHPHDQAPARGAGHRGRRRRHRVRRVRHDGAGRGRHPDEHRPGGGAGSGRDGARDGARGRGRARWRISRAACREREIAVPSSPARGMLE